MANNPHACVEECGRRFKSVRLLEQHRSMCEFVIGSGGSMAQAEDADAYEAPEADYNAAKRLRGLVLVEDASALPELEPELGPMHPGDEVHFLNGAPVSVRGGASELTRQLSEPADTVTIGVFTPPTAAHSSAVRTSGRTRTFHLSAHASLTRHAPRMASQRDALVRCDETNKPAVKLESQLLATLDLLMLKAGATSDDVRARVHTCLPPDDRARERMLDLQDALCARVSRVCHMEAALGIDATQSRTGRRKGWAKWTRELLEMLTSAGASRWKQRLDAAQRRRSKKAKLTNQS
jgi:hypothetical protein